mmetsp:Transcript_24218/g.53752  ORF Transcript_24218/g.53752 Transcript_24218/m.53752 type:complete len:545 (-) Transcript_24218:155-1789(-)
MVESPPTYSRQRGGSRLHHPVFSVRSTNAPGRSIILASSKSGMVRSGSREFLILNEIGDMDIQEAGLSVEAEASIMRKAWIVGTGLEMFLVIVGFLLFYRSLKTWIAMGITFLMVAGIRGATRLPWCSSGEDSTSVHRRWRFQMLFHLLPFVIYLPMLVDAYLLQCNYEIKSSVLDAPNLPPEEREFGHGNITFPYYTVRCRSSVPGSVMFGVQAAAQIGVPTLFAFMFVKLSGPLWQIDLVYDEHRAHMQGAMLDLLDTVTFITMPVFHSTYVFLKENQGWIVVLNGLFVVAFLSVILQLMILSPVFACCRGGKRKSTYGYLVSLLLNDLPFMVFRIYLGFKVGVAISFIMLLKNVICGISAIAVMAVGTKNKFTVVLRKGVNFLPGASDVSGETAKLVFAKTTADLQSQKEKLEEQKKTLAELKKSVQLREAQTSALEDIYRILQPGDEMALEAQEDPLTRAQRALTCFDFNGSGTLDASEIDKLLSMMPRDIPQSFTVKNILRECRGEDEDEDIEISVLANVMVHWNEADHEDSTENDSEG